MKKTYALTLHIFRRDLRLDDNTALIEALTLSQQVIPCFIFDSRQIEDHPYQSRHALQFMTHSLHELDEALQEKQSHLYCFYGIAEQVVAELLQHQRIEAVFINRDYTPFSQQRDKEIEKICAANNVDFHCYADALLNEPEAVLKPNHQPYTVFTHAYKKALQLPVSAPRKNGHVNYYSSSIALEDKKTLPVLLQQPLGQLFPKGGRKEATQLVKNILQVPNYPIVRNFPAVAGTSFLSAHNKFGTISCREFYQAIRKALGGTHTLITEIYWRDFFTHIAFHYPHVFGQAFHKKYDKIQWRDNPEYFRAWCEGKTGFPIVDAGMRQLNMTGFMHNRVRMITASFLTKDLHIDWRLGERYFAQQLVDYDPAVNNGNWQWAASTGCDAQPYFRIFNPWLQQQKFDPDCVYIKQYVPELAPLTPKIIHTLNKFSSSPIDHYPSPIVNHATASQYAKQLYKNA